MMQPTPFVVPLQGGTLAGYHWPNPTKPALLMLHANGLNARSYRQFLSAFVDHYDVRALDLRGHGKTTLPADPKDLKNWHVFKEDVLAFLTTLDLPPEGITLMGHSLGAVISLMVVGTGKVNVADLIMIEPVLMPEIVSRVFNSPLGGMLGQRIPIAQEAKKRRGRFASKAEVQTSYENKPFFTRWAPHVLRDYLEDGVVPAQEGVRLACDPAWEAACFAGQKHNLWDSFRAMVASDTVSPILIYGEENSTAAPQARRRFAQVGARSLSIKDSGHLVPLEHPTECSHAILSLLGKNS